MNVNLAIKEIMEKSSYFMDKAEEKSHKKDKHMTVSGVGRDGPYTRNTQTIFENSHIYGIAIYQDGPAESRHRCSLFMLRYILKSRSMLK